jgi:hypothetical protein
MQAEAMSRTLESESDLQRTVISYLKTHRIFHWRQNTGAVAAEHKGKKRFIRYGWPGLPDIFAVIGQRIVGIELKSKTGQQTQAQFQFEQDFTQAGGVYILARSLQDVLLALEAKVV